ALDLDRIEEQQQHAVAVGVPGERERAGADQTDAQLLVELASERRHRVFVGLDLAAGKLPEAAQVLVVGAPGDEDPAVVASADGGDDDDHAPTPSAAVIGGWAANQAASSARARSARNCFLS